MKIIAQGLLLLLASLSPVAFSQSFDDTYEAYLGSNGDILVRQKPQIIILHGDIATPIVLPPPVEDFVLLPAGTTYSVSSDTSNFDLATAELVDLVLGDFNVDGLIDIIIKDIYQSYDQIVFANNSGIPETATAVTEEIESFFSELYQWIFNPNFYEENADVEIEVTEETILVFVNLWDYDANDESMHSGYLAGCLLVADVCTYHLGPLEDIVTEEQCDAIEEAEGDCEGVYFWVFAWDEEVEITETEVLVLDDFNQEALDLTDEFENVFEAGFEISYGELADITADVSDQIDSDIPIGESCDDAPAAQNLTATVTGRACSGLFVLLLEAMFGVAVETSSDIALPEMIYRAFGGGAPKEGRSWTPDVPSTVPDFRDGAGLPYENTCTHMVFGWLLDDTGMLRRPALPIINMPSGYTVYGLRVLEYRFAVPEQVQGFNSQVEYGRVIPFPFGPC